VAGELLEEGKLEAEARADVAATYPPSVVQRAGWLHEDVAGIVGTDLDTEPLVELARQRAKPAPLAASGRRVGPGDRRWNVRLNATVEPEP
jgi:hypothetical protein